MLNRDDDTRDDDTRDDDDAAPAAEVLRAEAERLVEAGDLIRALDVLRYANRLRRDPDVELRLVELRHLAFEHLDAEPAEDWPPRSGAPLPTTEWPPPVPPEDLDEVVVGDGLAHHGAVLVKELLTPEQTAHLRAVVDHAFSARERARGRQGADHPADPWFAPFRPEESRGRMFAPTHHVRTADSPRGAFEVFELLHDTGLRSVVTEFLGERPAASANKSNLRRVPPGPSGFDFHQDGAFLGSDIRTVNVWIALSRCGVDAPGLDLVPRRVERVLDTGVNGAAFDWTVSALTVEQELGEVPVVRPEFEPGDVLLFDQLLLHRTGRSPDMVEQRYAVESWFFAPSAYPADHLPLVV